MDSLASLVEEIYLAMPDWAGFLTVFGGLYVIIGLVVRSRLLAAGLGALTSLAVLSLVFLDFLPLEEMWSPLGRYSAAYGALVAGFTAVFRVWTWKYVRPWLVERLRTRIGSAAP